MKSGDIVLGGGQMGAPLAWWTVVTGCGSHGILHVFNLNF
jgi:hypothetical protein